MTDVSVRTDTPAAAAVPRRDAWSALLRRLREFALVPALAALMVLGAFVNDTFLTKANLISILGSSAALALPPSGHGPIRGSLSTVAARKPVQTRIADIADNSTHRAQLRGRGQSQFPQAQVNVPEEGRAVSRDQRPPVVADEEAEHRRVHIAEYDRSRLPAVESLLGRAREAFRDAYSQVKIMAARITWPTP